MTVFLQYRAENDAGVWSWVPAAPGMDQTLTYDLQPGEAVDLQDGDWVICANRVRIWANAGNQQFNRYQNEDFWLVPETNSEGYHGYNSPTIQRVNLAFR
jgi:hypothetical protein